MVSIEPPLNLLRLTNYPIFQQLQLEEALLRADEGNWCLINEGSSPAIVMGISGHFESLINKANLEKAPIPVIRRFSGGGTVIVDSDTLFVSFICNSKCVQVSCCPQKVMNWSGQFYQTLLPGFRVRENDYVLGDRKFGGNAQYFRKDRWLHHSSLLWDFKGNLMDYLALPIRMPAYREKRDHENFLCKLKDHISCKATLHHHLMQQLHETFQVTPKTLEDTQAILARPHRQATCYTFNQ